MIIAANIPRKDEVWIECWQVQLNSDTAIKLLTYTNLDGGSTVVLDKLLCWEVIGDAEMMNLNALTNLIEKNRFFFKILSRKSEDNVRKAIEAFRPDQDVSANILEGMLNQALEEMNSKLVQ
jgi:hypothetical protein